MVKVFITGSSDGLGLMAGRLLAGQGHAVVLHARSEARAADARAALPKAEAVLVGDLSTLAAVRGVADQANGQGRFDAVIHNVGIGSPRPSDARARRGRRAGCAPAAGRMVA
jgi:NAD(P)-dependent dehydrogenase (short-subunit alcohol dehydrogenase family)